jgi:hypothetical protein
LTLLENFAIIELEVRYSTTESIIDLKGKKVYSGLDSLGMLIDFYLKK